MAKPINGETPSSKQSANAKKVASRNGRSASGKPAMPSAGAINNARKGGLGRGLGALIPTGPARPSLGNGAADVILGASRKAAPTDGDAATKKKTSQSLAGTGNAAETKRHSDFSSKGGTKGEKRSTQSISGDSSSSASATVASAATDAVPQDGPTASEMGATYREIPLSEIRTNAKQPRSVFDEEALKELEHSIREFGLMQPIVVREVPDGETRYELIMGERRLRASTRVGLELIPAIVRETEDESMLRDALLENIHRVQLNPLEEAAAYQQLLEEFGVNQSELAERIGRSRPRITNMIRLLQLPVTVQRRVAADVLSAGHARALLGLKAGVEAQEALAQRIVQEGMSVRATEEAVILLNRQAGDSADGNKKRGQGSRAPLPSHVSHWVDDISDALDTKVSVQMGKKRGKIVVEFGGPDDFDRIIELLKFQNGQ